jgi:transcriptional regulator with XRE-family HTH domain
MNFGQKIKQLMRRDRLSQQQLADLVGVSQNLVSLWARGKSYPDLPTAFRLATQLDVPLVYLADDGLDEEPPVSELTDDDRYLLRTARALNLDLDAAIRGLHIAATSSSASWRPPPVGVYEAEGIGLPIGEAYGDGAGLDEMGRPVVLWRLRLKGVEANDQPKGRYALVEGVFVPWEG